MNIGNTLIKILRSLELLRQCNCDNSFPDIGVRITIIDTQVTEILQILESGAIVGPQGEPGPQGEQGIQGEQGEQGIQSIQDATDVDTTAIADDKILVAKAITGGFKHVYEDKPTGGGGNIDAFSGTKYIINLTETLKINEDYEYNVTQLIVDGVIECNGIINLIS